MSQPIQYQREKEKESSKVVSQIEKKVSHITIHI